MAENFGNLPICGLQMQEEEDWVANNPVPVPFPVSSAAAIDADLYFSLQDPHHQSHFLLAQQNLGFDCFRGASSSSFGTDIFSSTMPTLPHYLNAQLELQRQELDYILHVQSERLRSALQVQRKQQLGLLLKSVESKAMNLMRQREEYLAQATNKAMELEVCLRKAEMERESWQRLARANEAMVMDLSNTLEQVKERMLLVSNNRAAEDAESVCGGSCDDDDDVAYDCNNNGEQKIVACKRCNSRNSCVLFLPCRHLCSCKQCETFLASCPVCKSAKEATMEVFWF